MHCSSNRRMRSIAVRRSVGLNLPTTSTRFHKSLTRVPDAVQRARYVRAAIATPAWRGALLIRDRNKLVFVRSRFCSVSFRFAPCRAAPGTRNHDSEYFSRNFTAAKLPFRKCRAEGDLRALLISKRDGVMT